MSSSKDGVGMGWEDQPADQVSSVRFGARRGPTVTGGQVVAKSYDEADQEERQTQCPMPQPVEHGRENAPRSDEERTRCEATVEMLRSAMALVRVLRGRL
jgi:hypothetical protein